MASFLVPIIVFLSVILVAIVLVQKSKGGGLAAGFQSGNSTLGAPKTADFLEKATWSGMAAIAVLCILCTVFTHKGTQSESSALQASGQMETFENVADEAPVAEEAAE